MRPDDREMTTTTLLRDRVRGIDPGTHLPTELLAAYARHAAALTARARRGERTPDAVLYPYRHRLTGQAAVYVWRALAIRRQVAAQRLDQPRPEGAA